MMPDAVRSLIVAAYTPDPWESACPVLRLTGPCTAAGIPLLRGSQWEGNTLQVTLEAVNEADVVVIQRDFPRFWENYESVVACARGRGLPVIYDLDDLLFGLPETHPDWRHYRERASAYVASDSGG